MTPDKVEAALASLKQLSAAIACPDLPRRTRADESRWAAKITDALSVLTEALAERGWRAIESAPRDGTYVLLTDNRCNPCHLIARWKFDRWWGQATPSGKSIIWTDATHWQPLPEPPHDR